MDVVKELRNYSSIEETILDGKEPEERINYEIKTSRNSPLPLTNPYIAAYLIIVGCLYFGIMALFFGTYDMVAHSLIAVLRYINLCHPSGGVVFLSLLVRFSCCRVHLQAIPALPADGVRAVLYAVEHRPSLRPGPLSDIRGGLYHRIFRPHALWKSVRQLRFRFRFLHTTR
ncbi:opsin-5 [Trichonephila inaurata madagascariensis]|uniref:Opsin-5 n=1 Tax=Trichonephila inaurata madagascariensis TaxID=2747483 RepID=A0A8X6X9V6_9ARAC|nr:opsin-5 [Trichonephila inaurata madagascariensis]